jgi:hypothetical protein
MSVTIGLSKFISVEMFGQLALPDTRPVQVAAETNDFFETGGGLPDFQIQFVTPDLSSGLPVEGLLHLLPTSIVNWSKFNPNKQLGR